MTQVLKAVFDGTTLQFSEPIRLAPNTPVTVTLEPVTPEMAAPYSSFELALSLQLEGPTDMSENVDKYLYGWDDDDEK